MHWYCLSHYFLLSELSAWIRALDSSRWWVLGQFILHTCQVTDQWAAGMQAVSQYSYNHVVQSNSCQVTSPLLCPYRINVDSMKMSDHVEFVAPQISDLAEPMAKRLLEGLPLTWDWTHHDLPSLHELVQEVWSNLTHSPQVKWPVRMNTISIFGIPPQINPWGQTFWLC